MKTIVYIDDDLDDISMFQEAVKEVDPTCVVESFSDSQSAIAYLEDGIIKPDIIFLDINMPGLSGKQTLMLIRRNRDLKDVPVVMYSTTIHGADKKTFIELGANEFLEKPASFQSVVNEVRLLLARFS